MFDYIVKDVMEVVGYLPIGILCGILAVAIYLVCVWRAGRKKTFGYSFVGWQQ